MELTTLNTLQPPKKAYALPLGRWPEITLGDSVCKKIKDIYFKDEKWSFQVVDNIAAKFTELKVILRKFYAGQSDLEILTKLQDFSEKDIEDVFATNKYPNP